MIKRKIKIFIYFARFPFEYTKRVKLDGNRDPIPKSGHERLWQNAMREKDIYTYVYYRFSALIAFARTQSM